MIGLAIALQLALRKNTVTLLAPGFAGAASPASAGMLAPSVERTQGAAQTFGDASRDAWPRLAALVERAGGGTFEIRRDGILRIARSPDDVRALHATLRSGDTWLTTDDAQRRLPHLAPVAAAALYAGDGVVDAPTALAAMERAVRASPLITVEPTRMVAFDPRGGLPAARLANDRRIETDALILAAGAWTSAIIGLPRAVPIKPLRGVMVAVEAALTDVPVYDAEGHAYLLPRGSRTIVGATSDDVGFDTSAPAESATRLLTAAARVVPSILDHKSSDPWSGLRPMTPDGLALIGEDPAQSGLFYACGHGRNGFLQAALTAEEIAAMISGEPARNDLQPFNPTRFA